MLEYFSKQIRSKYKIIIMTFHTNVWVEMIIRFCLICSNDKEVVHTVKDLHNVGTFCGIVEMQDMGDKLRMIVMAHRRIRLIGQMVVDEKDEELENEIIQNQQASATDDKNGRRKRRRRPVGVTKEVEAVDEIKIGNLVEEELVAVASKSPTDNQAEDSKNLIEAEPVFEPVPLLMIEAENLKPLKFEVDTEMKVRMR